ncbi:MAG TPA: helix-turn-helix domain-containing protein, partial [Polyangiales bacterium]
HPLRVFRDLADTQGRFIGHGVLGGARAFAHVRDVSMPLWSVGAQLRPGAGPLLLGVPAQLLAGRHTPLSDVWGPEVDRMRERLLETREPAQQLALFEAWLLGRLDLAAELPTLLLQAVARLGEGESVARVVRDSGYSHRHFAARFERAVGLPPKLFARTQRLQHALRLLERQPHAPWASLALAAGYSDQPHLTREFRAFSGLTPDVFRRLSPSASAHVPLPTGDRPPGASAGTIRSRQG